MEYIYTSFVFIISIIEAALFYHVVCRRKIVEITYKQLLSFIGLYIVQMLLVGLQARGLPQNILIALLYYFTGIFFTGTNWFQNIKYWIICLLLSSVAEQILYQVIGGNIFSATEGYTFENVIICILVVLILYFIKTLFQGQCEDSQEKSSKILRILTPIVCLLSLGISYIAYVLEKVELKGQKDFTLFVLLVAILNITAIVIVVLHISEQREAFKLQAELENRYNSQQKEYFLLLLRKEEETKRFRHDILNHLLCLQDQLKRENYSDAKLYLDNVLKDLNVIREMQYDVGNEIFNVLLNYYLLPIEKRCNIIIEGYLGKLNNISQVDLCTIISNLLKNANEAVNNDGEIKVCIVRKEKFAKIEISNTFSVAPQINREGELETIKLDKKSHGYGIKNVKKAIKKIHGKFAYTIQKNHFIVQIILPIQPFTTKGDRSYAHILKK